MTTSAGLAARFAAWRVLHDVRHDVPFDLALRRAIVDLGEEDQRLVHELAAGVFRTRSGLDRALGGAVARGLASVKADTLDILRLGAFQLLSLDRVPAHAAIQTTVAVAKRIGGEKVAGFVNAVLRKVQQSGTPGAGAGSDAGTLAERHSHPEWLVGRWLARLGPAETEALLAHNNGRPPLTIQPARWARREIEDSLGRQGVAFADAPFGAGLTVEVRKPTMLAGFAEGGFIVQDAAQQLVATFLAPEPGCLLFDACAAPGGKTVILAPRVTRVVAADRTGARLRRLADTVGRAGNGRIDLIRADAARPPLARAEAVLLDVPCLGTGSFARNPDARWRVTERALGSLVEQAGRFLRAAAEIVSPGGLLLFATCSLEPEENETQIDRFLSQDNRFRREPSAAVPAELLTEAGDLFLLPQRTGTDGGYAARLRKISG